MSTPAASTFYIAVHKIDITDPDACMSTTGRFHQNGEPILRRERRVAAPGTWLAASDLVAGQVEIERLLALKAIREPSDAELALKEKIDAARNGAPSSN